MLLDIYVPGLCAEFGDEGHVSCSTRTRASEPWCRPSR